MSLHGDPTLERSDMIGSRDVPTDGPRVLDAHSVTQAHATASAGVSQPLADHAPAQSRGRYVHGEERTADWMILTEMECPRGHHLTDENLQVGNLMIRCRKCGVLMWALFVVHSVLVFVAEVDREDIDRIKTLRGLLPILDYLGERTRRRRAA